MKKIVSIFLLTGLFSYAADAAPSHIRRDSGGAYRVTYDYTDKAKSGWYATFRAELSLLNWKNTYSSDDVDHEGYDKYSFQPVFGGSLSVGKRFNYFWRGELELGYTGIFTDKDEGFEFNFSAPYALANVMYDFQSGIYLGAGLGAALPITSLDGDIFIVGSRSKVSLSPMAGLMVGYSKKLDDNFVLDFRYRIAGFKGTKHVRNFEDTSSLPQQYYLENNIGFVLDNSFSVGLRYGF